MRRAFTQGMLLLSIVVLVACSEPEEYQPIIKSVISTEPTSPSEITSRTLSGILQPVEQSVLSFKIPGVIESVNVNLGDRFEKGQVLATIEPTVFDLAVQQRRGQLSEVNARLTEARLDFERKSQLATSGAISKAEVDIAESRFESIKDQVRIAQTQVKIAQEDLADTQLVAPYAGSVAQRHVEPSQQISPSTTIFTIQGSDALEVAVLVPESMISQIETGDPVLIDVLIDQARTQIQGTVFERGKQAQRANAFPVTVAIDVQDKISVLQPGMSAEVTFTSRNRPISDNILKAPLSAVAADANNSHYVYALLNNPGGLYEVKKVAVKVTSMDTNHVLFVPSSPVKQLVVNGLDFLRDGQQVMLHDGNPRTVNE